MRLELGQVEQVAHEALQPARLGDDHVGRLSVVLDRPVLDGFGKPADGGERGPQVVRDRQEEVTLSGAPVLEALGHVVDGAGQRCELGIVVAPDRDAACELARRDAAGDLHGLHQRASHATAHLPRHQRGDEQRRAAGDDEVAPAGPEAADVTGEQDGERAGEAVQPFPFRRRQRDGCNGVDEVAHPTRGRLPGLDRRHVDVLRGEPLGQRGDPVAKAVDAYQVGVLELERGADDAQHSEGTSRRRPWTTSGSRPPRPAGTVPGCVPRCGSG